MHPDLATLKSHYDQLLAQVQAGHFSAADALSALAGLSAQDGAGAVWKINPQGEFTRADFIGSPDMVTDAAQFIDPASVVNNPETGAFNVGTQQAPTSPTWEQGAPTGVTDPFSRPAPAASGFGAVPSTSPAQAPGAGFGAPGGFGLPGAGARSDTSSASTPTAAAARSLSRKPKERPAKSLAAAEKRNSGSGDSLAGRLLAAAADRKALLVIIAAGVLLILVKVLGGGSDGDVVPTGSEDAVGGTPAELPGGGEGDPAADLPSAATSLTVVNVLESGNVAKIAKLSSEEVEPGDAAHAAAFFAGMDDASLTLVPGAVTAGDAAGTAEQQWEIMSGSDPVLSVPVRWVSVGVGEWKLASLPLPQ